MREVKDLVGDEGDSNPLTPCVQSMGSLGPSNPASDADSRGLSPCFFSRSSIFSTSPIGVSRCVCRQLSENTRASTNPLDLLRTA